MNFNTWFIEYFWHLTENQWSIQIKKKSFSYYQACVGVVCTVGKISALQPQGSTLGHGWDLSEYSTCMTFPPKLTQLSIPRECSLFMAWGKVCVYTVPFSIFLESPIRQQLIYWPLWSDDENFWWSTCLPTKEYHADTKWALQVSVKHNPTPLALFDYLQPSLSYPEISKTLVIITVLKDGFHGPLQHPSSPHYTDPGPSSIKK